MEYQTSFLDDYIKQEVFEFGYTDKELNYTPHFPFVRLEQDNSVIYKNPFCYIFKEEFKDRKSAEKRYNELLKGMELRKGKTYLQKSNKYIEIPLFDKIDGVIGEVDWVNSRIRMF